MLLQSRALDSGHRAAPKAHLRGGVQSGEGVIFEFSDPIAGLCWAVAAFWELRRVGEGASERRRESEEAEEAEEAEETPRQLDAALTCQYCLLFGSDSEFATRKHYICPTSCPTLAHPDIREVILLQTPASGPTGIRWGGLRNSIGKLIFRADIALCQDVHWYSESMSVAL